MVCEACVLCLVGDVVYAVCFCVCVCVCVCVSVCVSVCLIRGAVYVVCVLLLNMETLQRK